MLAIGEVVFDPATRRVFRDQVEVRLSPKAAGVLAALAETPGLVWSRDALLDRVWPLTHVGEEVLTHAIAELRRALGDNARHPRVLATIHKSGYRLLAPVAKTELGATRNPGAVLASLDDYAAYVSACDLYARGGRQNTQSAVELFLSVTQTSPNFAAAHTGFARAAAFLNTYYHAETGLLERALRHCEIAHRIASRSADAYAAQGFIYAVAESTERSRNCFVAALQLHPDSGETHYLLGRASLTQGNFPLSAIMFERAGALSPDDYHSLMLAGKVRQAMGDDQAARTDYARAFARLEQRKILPEDDFRALCCRARCLLQLGHEQEANELMDLIAGHPDPMNYHLACTFAKAGRRREALAVLQNVIDLGWRHRAWLDHDPDLDPLRGDREFSRMAASLG
jgi:DNA-binding winged helix-turn-helix (wHTH) protein/Tfp pilus assembly protein PilF